MSRPIPSPEEQHDWQAGVMPPVRRASRDLWIAFLLGAWAGGLSLLLMLAFIDSLPSAGLLTGCEAFPAECVAVAERSR